jgi:carbamoyltransferase
MANAYLGISGVNSHDAAAALVVGGKVLAAAEEERFNREKHTGKYPSNAIEFCLETTGVSEKDVAAVGYYFNPSKRYYESLQFNILTASDKVRAILNRGGTQDDIEAAFHSASGVERKIAEGLHETQLRSGALFQQAEFVTVDHHDAHAASAYLMSQFDRANVLVVDLIGEWDSTTMYLGEGNNLTRVDSIKFPDSLGKLYQSFTKYLGFTPNSDEYKVMGLAAYGGASYIPFFKELYILTPDGKFTLNRDLLLFCKGIRPEWDDRTTRELGPSRSKNEPFEKRHADIAYALQQTTEEILVHMVRSLTERTNVKDLCMAGGVALNALANQTIRERTGIERLFVQPASNDAGTAIGAALCCCFRSEPWTHRQPASNYYLGPQYGHERIEVAIVASGLKAVKIGKDYSIVVDALVNGEIVGVFNGRMEFGPRALGNRSIVADPRLASMKDIINAKVKFREGFRPFAPAILAEDVRDYFVGAFDSPFMTQTFTATDLAKKSIPATVHEDGTSRIQTVTRQQNPSFYSLIEAFKERTGVPVLLNTSLNINGEPIACTPEDAIRTFEASGIDVLLLGDQVLRK